MNRALVIKTYGTPEIADAILDGMALEHTEPLDDEAIRIVQAEIDRQKIVRSLVRVAVGNTTTPEEYADMMTRERYEIQRYQQDRGMLRKLGDVLLVTWACLWFGLYSLAEYLTRSDGT